MARGGFDDGGNFIDFVGHQTDGQREQEATRRRVACLKLDKTTEFLQRLEVRLLEEESERYKTIQKYTHQSDPEKLKVSNLPAQKIQIGDWEREATCHDNLVVKFYYAKQQILYEVSEHEGSLKMKINFPWSDVSAIRATFAEERCSTLYIELENPPKFWLEKPSEPMKHKQWTAIPDFTNGEATSCRRHTLTFSEGILEKHYEKLVHSSSALFIKNRGPLPLHDSPFFTRDQIYGSLKNQRDLLNRPTCQGTTPTPQSVLIQVSPVCFRCLHRSLMIKSMHLRSPVNNLVPTKTKTGSSLTEMTTQGIHSSLTEVSQGIQTPEGINLNSGGEYNLGSTNSLMLNGVDNQSEEHGASLGGGMNIRKEGHAIENQKFLNNINHDDGIPEDDFVFVNNKSGILDMMEAFVDMQLDEELNNKPHKKITSIAQRR